MAEHMIFKVCEPDSLESAKISKRIMKGHVRSLMRQIGCLDIRIAAMAIVN